MEMLAEIKSLVLQLSAFPHRAIRGPYGEAIFQLLEKHLSDLELEKDHQIFQSPIHFIQILYWLLGGYTLLLLLLPNLSWLAFGLTISLLWGGYRYFDWHASWLAKLPPQIQCKNFIVRKPNPSATNKLVLMAHWDTAPISIPYRPAMLKGFRSSVRMGLVVMLLATIATAVYSYVGPKIWLEWIIYGLIAYFLVQMLIISLDFWRFGYANGANDNASGCAVSLYLARKLWEESHPDWEIELCITGAEEVGMIGAHAYTQKRLSHTNKKVFVLNFDTIGCKHLQLITASGTFSRISYESPFLTLARHVQQEQDFGVRFAPYTTADVDTAPIIRSGIPALSLISHNDAGLPAFIHRPEDIADRLHWESIEQAYQYALAICQQLIQQEDYVQSQTD